MKGLSKRRKSGGEMEKKLRKKTEGRAARREEITICGGRGKGVAKALFILLVIPLLEIIFM